MMDGQEWDEAGRLVDDWQAGIEEHAARTRELSARLASLTAAATSDDGLVTVTVGSTGLLTGLELDEGIRRRPAGDTARTVLATLRTAHADLTARATAATEETLGAGSPTGRAVIASYAARQAPADD